MGTNYYLHKNVCKHCEKSSEELHIGKSSSGWYFSLHIIPEENINSLDDWIVLFNVHAIKNEYGKIISTEEMLSTIRERSSPKKWDEIDWVKDRFYKSESEFHTRNHSARGLNGLAKHKIDGRCIGYGYGAYSHILGEFS